MEASLSGVVTGQKYKPNGMLACEDVDNTHCYNRYSLQTSMFSFENACNDMIEHCCCDLLIAANAVTRLRYSACQQIKTPILLHNLQHEYYLGRDTVCIDDMTC